MKPKVALIQPYFGTLPNYFVLALQSYAFNSDFDWYLFTDDRSHHDYPPNVFVTHTTLDRLRDRFQEHFDFPLALERPYKLCDYKPLYGHLFADYLNGYDFWGHFDPDIIFGRISHFVTDELYQRSDKIFDRGHFALYRNCPAVNLVYRERVAHCVDYRVVLASERNWAFDEREDGVNAFFAPRNLKLYTGSPIANIFYGDYALRLCGEAKGEGTKSDQSCFAYEQGGTYRHFLLADEIHREEFMYIHLQKRRMEVLCRDPSTYLIYGNAFHEAVPITKSFLRSANPDRFFYRFFWRKRNFTTRIRTAWRMLVLEHDYRKFGVRLLRKVHSLLGLRRETRQGTESVSMRKTPLPEPRFPVLDTVRGLAFLMVVFSHMGLVRGLVTRGIGQFGVWIFFVLSAFLLSRPFFEAPARVKSFKELRTYIKHRAFRIFPPLALAVTAFCLVFPNFTWEMGVANFLCWQGYGIFWTIFVETRYYLLLPLVVAAVLLLRSRPTALLVILTTGVALNLSDCPFWLPLDQWRALSAGPSATWMSGEHRFLQYLPLFVGGTVLAALHLAMLESSIWAERLRRFAPIGFLATLLSFVVWSPSGLGLLTGRSISSDYYHGLWLPMLPLPGALVLFAASLTGGFERFCGNPVFRYFGQISYSGYLFHVLFVVGFNSLIRSNTLYISAVLAATLAVATASHYLVERPFIAFSRRR